MVAAEVQRFFRVCLELMAEQGFSPDQANAFLALGMGAMLVSSALDDPEPFDRAVGELTRLLQAFRTSSR